MRERIDFEIVTPEKRKQKKREKPKELSQSDIRMIITNRIEHHKHSTGNQEIISELRTILHVISNGGIQKKQVPVYILNIVLEKMKLSYEDVFHPLDSGLMSQKRIHTLCRGIIIYFMKRHTPLRMEDIMHAYIGQATEHGDYLVRRLRQRLDEDYTIQSTMIEIDDLIQEYLSKEVTTFIRKEPIDFLSI